MTDTDGPRRVDIVTRDDGKIIAAHVWSGGKRIAMLDYMAPPDTPEARAEIEELAKALWQREDAHTSCVEAKSDGPSPGCIGGC